MRNFDFDVVDDSIMTMQTPKAKFHCVSLTKKEQSGVIKYLGVLIKPTATI